MESFEELGLEASLVEALAAEGMERPTAFQQAAIPVMSRGNNLIGRAGPGSGCRAAVAVALLGRLDADADTTRAVVLVP
nr:ATP-dependent helicase [Gammaproteobacteria bacterium]